MTIWRRILDSLMTSNVINASGRFVLGAMFVSLASGASHIAMAQSRSLVENVPDFAPAMIDHAQKMRKYKDHYRGVQVTPPVIDRFVTDRDPTGVIATFQPNGATITANNAFFKALGNNDRTCFSCHKPKNGWTVSADDVAKQFEKTRGTDPIFRLVDGAVCPTADVSTLAA